jgi:hypothetical protein
VPTPTAANADADDNDNDDGNAHVVSTTTPPAKLAQTMTNLIWAVLMTTSPTAPRLHNTVPMPMAADANANANDNDDGNAHCRHHHAARKAGPNDDQNCLGCSVCFLVLFFSFLLLMFSSLDPYCFPATSNKH